MQVKQKCFMAIMMTWGLDFLTVLIHRKLGVAICNGFILDYLNPLYAGNPQTGTFTNNEDPAEMPHYAAFHKGLHCLL